jgi:hypothetical protein
MTITTIRKSDTEVQVEHSLVCLSRMAPVSLSCPPCVSPASPLASL